MRKSIVKEWVSVNSDQGQRLVAHPDANFALYNPEDHPDFEPLDWNKRQNKGSPTNCMAYAMQAPEEIMFPGFVRKGKHPYKYRLAEIYNNASRVSLDEFKECAREGLKQDGAIRASADDLYKPGHYLVALCFVDHNDPSVSRKDFHFMVLNSNGNWSHLNGDGKYVSWMDRDDNEIKNPATSFLGNHMMFDSFWHVPRGGAQALRGNACDLRATIA